MGVNIRDLIPESAISQIKDLRLISGKVVAIDGYNSLYQFLAAIRQPDGTPLQDSRGRITSHLSGIFYRTINLMEVGIKPVYVFDGKPPEMKQEEIERRRKRREEAKKKYEQAVAEGKIEEARKYAQQATQLTNDMVKHAMVLLDYMGVPYVVAPAEGEAQAAYMAKRGIAWSTGSQDYDSLIFGSPRLARNITISGKRKLPGKDVYVEVYPEVIELEKLLKALGLTHDQLIDLAILIGTDYNPDGFENIGPKTAYQLIKTHGNLEKVFPKISSPYSLEELLKIREYFKNPPVKTDVSIEWREPDENKIRELLVKEFEFSEERVNNALERLKKAYREYFKGKTYQLDAWFKRR